MYIPFVSLLVEGLPITAVMPVGGRGESPGLVPISYSPLTLAGGRESNSGRRAYSGVL